MMPRDGPLKKDDDDFDYTPFQGIEKGAVLQETRLFNETPLNPRRCCHLLTKLLYLLAQGDSFTTQEATDVFFATTKLFQSQDVVLRRMTYLVLKELTPFAQDVIIVISSLTKDMNSRTDIYRANSIRVLCNILTDVALLGQGERYLKQAIVDKDPYVSSSSLVSGYHLIHVNPANTEVVKRWFNEIQDAAKSKYTMVQYHALGLLYKLRQHDRLAVSKLVSSMTRSTVRSPYAHCLLIRLASQVLGDTDVLDRALFEYLESCLRHKNEMMILEAARAICSLKAVTAKELTPAISVLQLSLSSPKATVRFAAVRTLNKVAQTHPLAVTTCNLDMENLITDVNRSIATLAITTLLKTGSESSVDRLMKQITSFMSEIPDDFKVVVVDAIKSLCIKFPKKQRSLMGFLSTSLRDEGGLEYKRSIVEAILTIISTIPEAKETGLSHLCEFIEDCEYTQLSTRVLHVLGEQGPTTTCPSKFIRYIYNRLILENANVRASAVSALAKFGRRIPELKPNVLVLLRRCRHDNDDEVRDRATFHLRALEEDSTQAAQLLDTPFVIPMENLETALRQYLASPSATPFDVSTVPTDAPRVPTKTKSAPEPARAQKPATAKASDTYAEMLAQVPALAGLGTLYNSSKPVELTESETEYTVNCVKHIFPEHTVLQFNCTNTLDDRILENVVVKVEIENEEEFEVEQEVPLARLGCQSNGASYVVMRRPSGAFSTGSFACLLKFTVKEIDSNTGDVEDSGYEDDYQLEELEITTSDYVRKRLVTNFAQEWDSFADENQMVETYALSTMKDLQAAVNEIIEFLGMQPVDQSESVPAKRTKHILYLAGLFLGNIPVLVRARMKLEPTTGVSLELTVRSQNDDVNAAIVSAI